MSSGARSLRVLIIIFVVGSVCASSSYVKPSSAGASSAAEKVVGTDGITFTLSLQRSVFVLGGPINSTLTVTNMGSQTATWRRTPPFFDLEVYDGSNQRVFLWSRGYLWPQLVMTLTLDPGDSITVNLVWPGTRNENLTNSDEVLVSPGRYFIVGYFLGAGLNTPPSEVDIISPTTAAFAIGALVVAPVFGIIAVALLTRKR